MSVYDGELKQRMIITIVAFLCEADPNMEIRKAEGDRLELFDHDGNWGFIVSNLVDHLIGDIII